MSEKELWRIYRSLPFVDRFIVALAVLSWVALLVAVLGR